MLDYNSVTGRVPTDSIDRIDDDDLILPSSLGVSIPEYAEDAIVKALSVRSEDRYQTMAEFKTALEINQPEDTEPPKEDDNDEKDVISEPPPKHRFSPGLIMTAVFVVAAVIIGIIIARPKSDSIIEIPDPVLRQAIQEKLGLRDMDIKTSEAKNLTELTYDGLGKKNDQLITDLTGLGNFSELEELNLSCNLIQNVGELSKLKKLRSLSLSANRIKDISPLKDLKKLESALLDNNQISDLYHIGSSLLFLHRMGLVSHLEPAQHIHPEKIL